ncbi:hypothetical protein [Yersinia aldovae]|uniref:hypothetical protein n=1 Tax=Yersinia aldovae TaxID=29483 RepID=UPI0011A4BC24|nr:hypothetical protein [Yersinia aldovae]
MDEQEVKHKLLRLGVSNLDADTLINMAKKKNTSVSRVFLMSLRGLYMGTLALVVIYFAFTFNMNTKEFIAFSAMYIPIILIIYFLTPSLKTFFWSLKVLFNLKGK